MFRLNPYAWNPAVAGTENTLIATGVYRQQWTDLEGAPIGQQVNMHLPFYRISSGLGIKLDNDAIGAHRSTQAMVSYAYHKELGRSVFLSLGVSAGYMQYALDGTKLRAPEGTYAEPSGTFSHNDSQIPEGKLATGTPVFEAGVHLEYKNATLGFSSLPVFAPVIEAQSGGTFRLKPQQHYIMMASYKQELGKNWYIEPSIFAKTDFLVTQIDLSFSFHWQENIFAGASYRGFTAKAQDAFVIMGGWRMNEKTTIAYSFDLPLSPLKQVNRGSHELLVRYSLNKPIGRGVLPPVIYNPRFW